MSDADHPPSPRWAEHLPPELEKLIQRVVEQTLAQLDRVEAVPFVNSKACAELLGGMGPLAKHLNVSEQQLAEWVAGRSSPPPEIVSRAVEPVIAATRPGGRR